MYTWNLWCPVFYLRMRFCWSLVLVDEIWGSGRARLTWNRVVGTAIKFRLEKSCFFHVYSFHHSKLDFSAICLNMVTWGCMLEWRMGKDVCYFSFSLDVSWKFVVRRYKDETFFIPIVTYQFNFFLVSPGASTLCDNFKAWFVFQQWNRSQFGYKQLIKASIWKTRCQGCRTGIAFESFFSPIILN
jgi:hypothetical protein